MVCPRFLITLCCLIVHTYAYCHPPPINEMRMDVCREPTLTNKEDCYKWCRNASSWNYTVLDMEKGVILFYLKPSPQPCNNDKIDIYLRAIEGVPCSNITSGVISEISSNIHTEHRILLNSSSSCSNNITLKFDYMFTGCYQLKIDPIEGSNSNQGCLTQLFDVVTNYTKELIPTPIVSSLDDDTRILFKANWEVKSPFWIQTLHFCRDYQETSFRHNELNEEPISENCTLGIIENEENIPRFDKCNCNWIKSYKNITLRCTFINVKDGQYRITMYGDDTRCVPQTLWTNYPCNWHYDYNFTLKNVTNEVTVEQSESAVILHWLTFAFLIILGILNVAVIYILYYKCYLQRRSSSYITRAKSKDNLNSEIDKLLSKKTKVLLLYPRDCRPFMQAMDAFRLLLTSINHFEVIDPHDPELFEEVISQFTTWGSQYILDESTKVILVASECSLKLEEAFIESYRLSYVDNLPIDNVFILLLHRLFSLNNDLSYRKIFVVRLDSGEIENLHFQVQFQCRNFTIPQSIDSLIHMLLSLPVETPLKVNDPTDKLIKLETAIKRYSNYLSENPGYIDDLLIQEDTSLPHDNFI